MKIFTLLWWSGVLVALTSLSGLGEAETLEGHVRDSRTHGGLAFAKVELLDRGVPIDRGFTNKEGEFRFVNLISQSYTVSAASPGYADAAVDVDMATRTRVDVELRRTTQPVQRTPPVVSLREYTVPENARKEFDRARKEIKRQDCAKAIEHLERGLRMYDQDASALNALGNCYRQLGEFESAEASFKRAMTLSSESYIAMNLAEVYSAQKRFRDAQTLLLGAIPKAKGDGDVYYALAAAYFQEGRLEEAETAALQADSRTHRLPDLHLLLAKIYAHSSPEKVAGQLEIYLKEAPNGAESKRIRQLLRAAKQN